MLLSGPAGWGEFCPFLEYDDAECAPWLAAAVEAADEGWPEPVRDRVPVNCHRPCRRSRGRAADRARIGLLDGQGQGGRPARLVARRPGARGRRPRRARARRRGAGRRERTVGRRGGRRCGTCPGPRGGRAAVRRATVRHGRGAGGRAAPGRGADRGRRVHPSRGGPVADRPRGRGGHRGPQVRAARRGAPSAGGRAGVRPALRRVLGRCRPASGWPASSRWPARCPSCRTRAGSPPVRCCSATSSTCRSCRATAGSRCPPGAPIRCCAASGPAADPERDALVARAARAGRGRSRAEARAATGAAGTAGRGRSAYGRDRDGGGGRSRDRRGGRARCSCARPGCRCGCCERGRAGRRADGQSPAARAAGRPRRRLLHRARPGVRRARRALADRRAGPAVDRPSWPCSSGDARRPARPGPMRWAAAGRAAQPGRGPGRRGSTSSSNARCGTSARVRWSTASTPTSSCWPCPTRRRCGCVHPSSPAAAALAGRAWRPVIAVAAGWPRRQWAPLPAAVRQRPPGARPRRRRRRPPRRRRPGAGRAHHGRRRPRPRRRPRRGRRTGRGGGARAARHR